MADDRDDSQLLHSAKERAATVAKYAAMLDPYYEDELVTLYCGDVVEVLPWLAEQKFDLAFADPPYNFGVQYDGYADNLPPVDYQDWCYHWFSELRALAPKVVVTPGHGNLPMWWRIAKPSGVGCWYKPGGTGSSHLGWCEWEPWLYWGQRLGGSDVIQATLNPTFKSDVGHPCPKPVVLVKKLIAKTKAESVIDPFCGSGSTLVAAKAMGIRGVGVEQSERYCEVAVKRLAQGVLV